MDFIPSASESPRPICRVSVGNAPYDAALRLVERITKDLLTTGRLDALFA